MGSHISTEHGPTRNSQLRVPKYDLNHFGVVTVVFNPIKYKSRYEAYHKFDEHMSRSGVTLLTVECIFEAPETLGLPKQKFEITRENDPRHLQIKASSVMWLKENLINIAVQRLPPYVEYVAWLDADIEFERLNWPHLAINALQDYPIVQLFEVALFLGPGGKKEVVREDYSFTYALRNQKQVDPRRSSECYVHPGYAWAMRRSTFQAMGGLLDFSILGSGDVHFAFALWNRIEETIPAGMHEDYRQLAIAWGQRIAELSGNGTLVGFVPLKIWHHWHGNRVQRGYFDRWAILERFQFSPKKDLEKNNQTGLLRLADRPRAREGVVGSDANSLEKAIVAYFRSREEDKIKKPVLSINATFPNYQSRIVPSDIERPKSTLPPYDQTQPFDTSRTADDNKVYLQLHDMHSGFGPSETDSFTMDTLNESFFHTSSRQSYPPTYRNRDQSAQSIYYDDENGNNHPFSPADISF